MTFLVVISGDIKYTNIKEASTHNSAKTYAGTVFVPGS